MCNTKTDVDLGRHQPMEFYLNIDIELSINDLW